MRKADVCLVPVYDEPVTIFRYGTNESDRRGGQNTERNDGRYEKALGEVEVMK